MTENLHSPRIMVWDDEATSTSATQKT